ncbi:MAG: hypothetical protein ACXAD7_21675 [Candidatus Kariarchaeaceae archaeon]|jgi:hypothetical protein
MKAIILLDEYSTTELDPKGQVAKSEGSGKILIKNPSDHTTLWAISLNGKHGPDISNFKNQSIPHIQAGKLFDDTYAIEHEAKLLLTERIDTYYTSQTGDELNTKRNTLVKGVQQKLLYEIQLENRYSFPMKNLIVTKQFDACIQDSDAIPPHPGSFEKTEDSAIWNIEHLGAGELATIYFVVELLPETSEKIKTGDITVTANGEGQFSSLEPSIDSECDNVDLSVNVNENPTPGMWTVTVAYTNSSEFATLLEDVQVTQEGEEFLKSSVNVVYQPNPDGAAWTQEETINHPDYPQIDKNFKYQVDHEVQTVFAIRLHKETDLLDVVEISSEKKFEPEEVNTYTRTPLKYMVDVTNKGTAEIGTLIFEEVIPPFILVKSVAAMGNENLQLTASIEGQEGLDDSAPENLKDARKMTVEVQCVDYNPMANVVLTVDCIAEKPKPNLDYHALSVVKSLAKEPTMPFTINSQMFDKVPELMVAYKKRSFKFSANYKALSDSEYEITIPVTNNGEVPLENVYVTQSILGGKYNSHSPLTIQAEEKADKIEFYLKAIAVGETVSIIMVVETQGPLRQQQPSIKVAD